MNKNNNFGFASLPIIIGGVVVAGLLITAVWVSGDKETETPTPIVNNEPPPTPTPVKSNIVWGAISPGVYSRTVSSRAQANETVSIAGSGTTALKVTTQNPKLDISLKDPDGQVITPGAVSATGAQIAVSKSLNQATGETTFIYQISGNQNTTSSNDWELVINNPTTNSPSTYDVTVSDSSFVGVDTSESSVTSDQDDNTSATLSLTVVETVAIGLTTPVTGASVVANVTDPNGNTTSVVLTEDPANPGSYEGTFEDIDEPGTYDVEYIVSGTNAAGEPFDQIVNDQFTVPDPDDSSSVNPTPTYNSTKKWDINQSGDVRPVQ